MIDVSIIVPVYNAEIYLQSCIDSLKKQTLKNIEIILIDDGSTDNSAIICDLNALEDNRIVVIHKKNSGVCDSRNLGLKIARGKYIGFVDSDDFISKYMYQKMLYIVKKYDVDFVYCDYNVIYKERHERKTLLLQGGYYNKYTIEKEIFPNLIAAQDIDIGIFNSQCFCLSKRELWERNKIIYNDKIKYAEDMLVGSQITYWANSFYYMKGDYLYNYRFNENSRSKKYKEDAWENYMILNNEFRNKFSRAKYNFDNQFDKQVIYFASITIRDIKKSKISFIRKYFQIKEIMKDKRVVMAFRNINLSSHNIKLKRKRKILFILIKFKCSFLYLLCTS